MDMHTKKEGQTIKRFRIVVTDTATGEHTEHLTNNYLFVTADSVMGNSLGSRVMTDADVHCHGFIEESFALILTTQKELKKIKEEISDLKEY